MMKFSEKELKIKSIQYRKNTLKYIKMANAGHTGGSLSCVDILNVLYNRVLNVSPETSACPDRDRYIQSKGHSVEALYTVLADKGFYPAEELDTLGRYKSLTTDSVALVTNAASSRYDPPPSPLASAPPRKPLRNT